MYNSKLKYISVFYSKNANLALSSKIKKVFDLKNSYTIYLQDIDEIILKNFSKIDFLILDYTSASLDEHSIKLLQKLKDSHYINQIIFISNDEKINLNYLSFSIFLKNDENLENKLNEIICNYENLNKDEKIYFDTNWIKLISDYLSSIGFCENKNGFLLLIDSIIYFLSKKSFSVSLSKSLFPYLALKYKVKICAIEMRIRSSIITASKSKKFPFEKCPTIKQFISYVITQLYSQVYSKEVIINNIFS